MCRLFGMTAGHRSVRATFWLLDDTDSLDRQSYGNPDGAGIGSFTDDGAPVVDKEPVAAHEDPDFLAAAQDRCSRTFVAHVRLATGTPRTVENTHPFELDGRLFAHNGEIGDVGLLDAELGPALSLVRGDTDSERIFALVTRNVRRGLPVGEAIAEAVRWLAENVPVLSLNLVLVTPTDLWALRCPETHELWLTERAADGAAVRHRSSLGTRVASDDLADVPCVVVASERLDDDPGWRLVEPGTLVHVGPDLDVEEQVVLDGPPRRRLRAG